MGLLATLKSLADSLNPKAADLIGDLVQLSRDEWRTDMIASTNEKVAERTSELHRRIHEDLAALELRVMREMHERFLAVERRFGELQASTHRWLVTVFIIQFGLLVALAWAQKHLF